MSITGTDVTWTELNDTPFFDFSATSIENHPFTDSDLDALRNLAVLIDTAFTMTIIMLGKDKAAHAGPPISNHIIKLFF